MCSSDLIIFSTSDFISLFNNKKSTALTIFDYGYLAVSVVAISSLIVVSAIGDVDSNTLHTAVNPLITFMLIYSVDHGLRIFGHLSVVMGN